MFKLPEGPHAHPAVFLSDRQQQRSDGIVELRNSHWIPGAQEHNVCTTRDKERQTRSIRRNFPLVNMLVLTNLLCLRLHVKQVPNSQMGTYRSSTGGPQKWLCKLLLVMTAPSLSDPLPPILFGQKLLRISQPPALC